jgi:oligopeptide transport system ATP-binding protein
MRPLRRELQMMFQDPFSSLNPRMTVGRIVGEPMNIFNLYRPEDRQLEVIRLLDTVGLNPRYMNRYPHEFSGGQRQRIGVARALAVQPKLIFCDEPVAALDVSIQAQVVNLLDDLQQRLGLSLVFIAHDLAIVRHISDRIGVMYLGRIVEEATSEDLYRAPKHPYTQALLTAVPIPDPVVERQRQRVILSGEVPSPEKVYKGCPFADRCPIVEAACRETPPQLEGTTHRVACFKAEGE